MTKEEFLTAFSYTEGSPAENIPRIVEEFFNPTELLTLKRGLDKVIDNKLNQCLHASSLAWERATYIKQYLNGDMFSEKHDMETHKSCQILNSQDIIDSSAKVLNIK